MLVAVVFATAIALGLAFLMAWIVGLDLGARI